MALSKVYTIASDNRYVAERFQLTNEFSYAKRYQAMPSQESPVVVKANKDVRGVLGVWQDDHLPFVSVKKVLQQPQLNLLFRKNRCVVLANCFFLSNASKSYLVRAIEHRLIGFGGIVEHSGYRNFERCKFRIMTTSASDVIGHLTSEMPVLLSPERALKWLDNSSLQEVMELADDSNNLWLDYFEVSNAIQNPGTENKELLKPLGLSVEQVKARERQMMAIKIKKDRSDRGSSKR